MCWNDDMECEKNFIISLRFTSWHIHFLCSLGGVDCHNNDRSALMLWNLWRVVLYNLESCRIRLDTLDNAGMHASGRRGRSRGRVQDSVVLILVRITCTSTKCSLALMTCQPPWCLKILEGRWTTKQSPRTEKDHGPLCDCQRRSGFTASLTAVFNWSSLKFMTAITGGAEWIFTGWPLHRREQHQFWSCYEDPSTELNPQLISFKLCRSRLDIVHGCM